MKKNYIKLKFDAELKNLSKVILKLKEILEKQKNKLTVFFKCISSGST